MKIKIKKIDPTIETKKPTYAKPGDAGMDLVATSKHYDEDGNVVFGTNLGFEIQEGYVGLLFPRSSNAKQDLILSNSVGVIDSGYRGEVFLKYKPSVLVTSTVGGIEYDFDPNVMKIDCPEPTDFRSYEIGDRVAQIIVLPYPKIEFEFADELSTTERGAGGYGSTGK